MIEVYFIMLFQVFKIELIKKHSNHLILFQHFIKILEVDQLAICLFTLNRF